MILILVSPADGRISAITEVNGPNEFGLEKNLQG